VAPARATKFYLTVSYDSVRLVDVDEQWTLSELVSEVAARIAALPAPSNGQVRAVPDERTVRYYGTIGLLDRPLAMRGRTALYGRRHLAQVVAIKRLQTMGRSLAEIQALWPTLDELTLARMSGIQLPPGRPPGRKDFWKSEPAPPPAPGPGASSAPAPALAPLSAPAAPPRELAPVELRVELLPGVSLSIAMSDDLALTTADVRAIRAAAAPLLDELARCRLLVNAGGHHP
jgi:DNA-binding transcriptional MerR regulator